MMKHTHVWKLVLCLLLLAAARAVAAPRIEVEVGFAGRFLPERTIPIAITISGLDYPVSGSLRIVQRIGNAWRGEATSTTDFHIGRINSGTYTEALPLYDFAHPLAVSLIDDAGNTITQETVDLRNGWSSVPLAVAVGEFPDSLTGDRTLVDGSNLPSAWSCYDGVGSLWIGQLTDDLNNEQWQAICRWTHAGGTTVVFTGSDIFLIDSPLVRGLISIIDPHVTDGQLLTGGLRPGADTIMLDESGSPLIVKQPYGAGTVFTVTKNAYSLTQEEIHFLQQAVSPADPVTILAETQEMLDTMKLSRPGYPTALALVTCVLLSLMVVVARTKNTHRIVIYLLSATVGLALWSGLYTNKTKAFSDIYKINTELYVQDSVGYEIVSYGIASIGSRPFTTEVSVAQPVIQELPHDLKGHSHSYNIALVDDKNASVEIVRGEERLLSGGGDCLIPVSCYQSGDERITIKNGLGYPLECGVFIRDGIAFSLGTIANGEATYTLSEGIVPDEFVPNRREIAALYDAVCKHYAIYQGTWVIGGMVVDANRTIASHREKVRDVKLIVVAGEQ